jgi:hypothetical protein
VIVALELEPEGRGRLGRAQESFTAHGFSSVWRVRTEREIGLVPLGDATIEDAVAVLDTITTGRVGISPAVNGLAEAGLGYLMAETALATIPPGGHGVALLDARLERALVVRAPDIAMRLRDRVLGPLSDLAPGERAILLETAGAYLDCGASASKTAARLFCHRNTIFNRLRRVEALTGRSLSDPKDLVALALALEADRLLPPA